MKELKRLQEGLVKSTSLVLKTKSNGLECSFIKGGLVIDYFLIEDKILATALSDQSVKGIVEGMNFFLLKNEYEWFALKVRSKMLLMELQEPVYA
jgi:hypothetical protein